MAASFSMLPKPIHPCEPPVAGSSGKQQRRQKSKLCCDTDNTHNHTIRTEQAFIMTVVDNTNKFAKADILLDNDRFGSPAPTAQAVVTTA
jgi:hypothetical protein